MTLQELIERVGKCFQKASSSATYKNLYSSIKNRLELCIENDGAWIDYWVFERNLFITVLLSLFNVFVCLCTEIYCCSIHYSLFSLFFCYFICLLFRWQLFSFNFYVLTHTVSGRVPIGHYSRTDTRFHLCLLCCCRLVFLFSKLYTSGTILWPPLFSF